MNIIPLFLKLVADLKAHNYLAVLADLAAIIQAISGGITPAQEAELTVMDTHLRAAAHTCRINVP